MPRIKGVLRYYVSAWGTANELVVLIVLGVDVIEAMLMLLDVILKAFQLNCPTVEQLCGPAYAALMVS